MAGGSLGRTKNLPEQSRCIWTEQSPCIHSSAAHLRLAAHTPPPHAEGGMGGAAGSSTRGHKTWACTPAPRPRGSYTACRGIIAMPTLPTPSTHPHTLSGAPQGAQAQTHTHTHTHTLIFLLLCTPTHTQPFPRQTIGKVSDYLLCSDSGPPEILASVMEIKLL